MLGGDNSYYPRERKAEYDKREITQNGCDREGFGPFIAWYAYFVKHNFKLFHVHTGLPFHHGGDIPNVTIRCFAAHVVGLKTEVEVCGLNKSAQSISDIRTLLPGLLSQEAYIITYIKIQLMTHSFSSF